MDEKELLKQAFEYGNVPSIITYCFTEPCPMKDKCIHYLSGDGILSVLEYIFYVFHVLFLYLVQIQGLSIERVCHKSVTHPHLFIRLYPNRSSIVICT